MGQIDDCLLERAESSESRLSSRSRRLKWGALAASLALAVLIAVPTVNDLNNRIQLGDRSSGVKAKYTAGNVYSVSSESMLIALSEEELFTYFETAIFEGTIKKLDNIVLNFNGHTMPRALAEIRVEQVYRGDLKAGDTAVILLPCNVGNGVWVEDTDTVVAMRKGMRGIFMPMVYDSDSTFEANGATLYLEEIADFGFPDGARYAFLDSGSAPIFDKWAYPSLEGVTSFDEIRDFVIEMIEKTTVE